MEGPRTESMKNEHRIPPIPNGEGSEKMPGSRICKIVDRAEANWEMVFFKAKLHILTWILPKLEAQFPGGHVSITKDGTTIGKSLQDIRRELIGDTAHLSFNFRRFLMSHIRAGGSVPSPKPMKLVDFMLSKDRLQLLRDLSSFCDIPANQRPMSFFSGGENHLLFQLDSWAKCSRSVVTIPEEAYQLFTSPDFVEYGQTTWMDIRSVFKETSFAIEFSAPMEIPKQFGIKGYIEGCLASIMIPQNSTSQTPRLHITLCTSDPRRRCRASVTKREAILLKRVYKSATDKGTYSVQTVSELFDYLYKGHQRSRDINETVTTLDYSFSILFDAPIGTGTGNAFTDEISRAIAGACIFVSEAHKAQEENEKKSFQLQNPSTQRPEDKPAMPELITDPEKIFEVDKNNVVTIRMRQPDVGQEQHTNANQTTQKKSRKRKKLLVKVSEHKRTQWGMKGKENAPQITIQGYSYMTKLYERLVAAGLDLASIPKEALAPIQVKNIKI